MNKTRRFASPKLNLGYVTDELSDRLLLPERLLENGNAVAVASVQDATAGVWRSYRLPRNGTTGFPAKEFLPDAVLFGPQSLVRDSSGVRAYGQELARITAQYHSPEIVDLEQFSKFVGVESSDVQKFATCIEDHLYHTPKQFAP